MNTVIKRTIFALLVEHLQKPEISLIIGPRQAGKTTLMLLLQEEAQRRKRRTLFLNLDIETDRQSFVTQEALLKKIRLEFGSDPGVVFIDEIQRKSDAGIFLKGLYDMRLPYKFVVSGSGSMELKEKIHESLAGRKIVFEVNTISFAEFLDYKTQYRHSGRLKDFFESEKIKADGFLEEYLCFGGYPKVVLEERFEDKQRQIDEIFRSYIERDIVYLLKSENIDTFSRLVRLLAIQTAGLVTYSALAHDAGIALPTVKNYVWYAQKTFVVDLITPFFRNRRKELIKSPCVYFYDLGLRNFAAGSFGKISEHEKGLVFQNFVFGILKDRIARSTATLNFWRTTDKAEVDFVLHDGADVVPVEVKYKRLSHPVVERSLHSFIETYKPREARIINLTLRAQVYIGGTKVLFVPYGDML